MIRRELGIWKRLNHPNIVPFLGTVSGFGRLGNTSLVSLWMPNGTLQAYLQKHDGKLTVAFRLQLVSTWAVHRLTRKFVNLFTVSCLVSPMDCNIVCDRDLFAHEALM